MILPVKRRISLNECNEGFLHVIVNGSVTLKSNASVGMTRHRSHQIRVFDLTEKITDKSSSGYMRSSHITDGFLLLGLITVTTRLTPTRFKMQRIAPLYLEL